MENTMKMVKALVHSCIAGGLLLAGFPPLLLGAPPEILAVRPSPPPEIVRQIRLGLFVPPQEPRPVKVGCFEKLELQIDLRAGFQNPYDPDDLDLWAEFQAPSGKTWKIWGFYNPSSWSALWMIRFTPVESGAWRYVVKVRDRQGTAESKPAEFSVSETSRRGFLRIAPNRRYLQYQDGSPFYGVGLWYNDGYELFQRGSIDEEGLDLLAQRGANFISFFPSPLETMGTGLGRYDENRAGRLDQIFEWCEKRDLHISWNLWFHSYISEAVWGGGNARYRNNPYRLLTPAEGFFASDEAWKYEQKLHRYIVARWGYSPSLFLWFVIDEINGTEGWLKGGTDQAERWCRQVHDWFKAHDPYGRPTTGTRSGGIKEWWPEGYRIFDIAAREIYEAQGHPIPESGKPDPVGAHPLRFSYLNYARQTQDLWKGFFKPAIIGECGWDHTYYEPGMPGYMAMYHNALWVGLANGLSMTPFWWAYGPYLNDSILTRSMLYFSRFVREIDFGNGEWKPLELRVSHGDGWAMQSAVRTFGWVVHPLNGVANETVTVPGLADGKYQVLLYRTTRGEYLAPLPAASEGGELRFTIPELKTTGGRAQHIGNDVAFHILPLSRHP